MSTLFIAEKPSQANDIGNVLGIKRRHDGYIETVKGEFITWGIGHMLQLAMPDAYSEDWAGRWKWDNLPMIPAQWKYLVNKKTSAQLSTIKKLVKTATLVVIATDAGREGELIAREILQHCAYRGTLKRLWTSSLVASDIKRALDSLKAGEATYPLYEAALARQRSDWIYGISGTRAVTLAANIRGSSFPMGRVQTPTLALVVRRCLEVKNFKATAYYELDATVRTQGGHSLTMKHAPDEANRITSRETANLLCKKAERAKGVLKVDKTKGTDSAPLPYSLPGLQKDANRVYGFTAKNTLKLAQALYEKKAITYPRTDCEYLAVSQMAEVIGVLEVVKRRFNSGVSQLLSLGVTKRPSTFNDAKLTDHHGIIPTAQFVELEGAELQLYTLIAQRYLQLLGPDCHFESTKISLDANGVPFKATGRVTLSAGWKSVKLI
jgi:DNA topoisomerase III